MSRFRVIMPDESPDCIRCLEPRNGITETQQDVLCEKRIEHEIIN